MRKSQTCTKVAWHLLEQKRCQFCGHSHISCLLCNKCCCCREAHVSQVQSFFFTIVITAAISVVLGCLPRNICSRVESIVFSSGNETVYLPDLKSPVTSKLCCRLHFWFYCKMVSATALFHPEIFNHAQIALL